MPKFKIGDRVVVVVTANGDDVGAGAVGTVKENSTTPWIYFDLPTTYSGEVKHRGIPAGYADCIHEDQLELLGCPSCPSGPGGARSAQDDVLDYGIGFEVDGLRVAPIRVRVFKP